MTFANPTITSWTRGKIPVPTQILQKTQYLTHSTDKPRQRVWTRSRSSWGRGERGWRGRLRRTWETIRSSAYWWPRPTLIPLLRTVSLQILQFRCLTPCGTFTADTKSFSSTFIKNHPRVSKWRPSHHSHAGQTKHQELRQSRWYYSQRSSRICVCVLVLYRRGRVLFLFSIFAWFWCCTCKLANPLCQKLIVSQNLVDLYWTRREYG